MGRFKNTFIAVLLIIILLLLSNFIWYEVDINYVFGHKPEEIEGVKLTISANPTDTNCQKFLAYCKCESKAPYKLVFRAIDANKNAEFLIIHSAKIRYSIGQSKDIEIINEGMNGKVLNFYENATEWIVHAYSKDVLSINEQFAIDVDMTLSKQNRITRKIISFRLHPKTEKTNRIVLIRD